MSFLSFLTQDNSCRTVTTIAISQKKKKRQTSFLTQDNSCWTLTIISISEERDSDASSFFLQWKTVYFLPPESTAVVHRKRKEGKLARSKLWSKVGTWRCWCEKEAPCLLSLCLAFPACALCSLLQLLPTMLSGLSCGALPGTHRGPLWGWRHLVLSSQGLADSQEIGASLVLIRFPYWRPMASIWLSGLVPLLTAEVFS